jgi:hypothetical protein
VGAASANRGCSADTPHTAVPASVSVPIWGTPVEMLLAHETIHRLDVLASSTCNTHLPHLSVHLPITIYKWTWATLQYGNACTRVMYVMHTVELFHVVGDISQLR